MRKLEFYLIPLTPYQQAHKHAIAKGARQKIESWYLKSIVLLMPFMYTRSGSHSKPSGHIGVIPLITYPAKVRYRFTKLCIVA